MSLPGRTRNGEKHMSHHKELTSQTRRSVLAGLLVGIVLAAGGGYGTVLITRAANRSSTAWPEGKTYELSGLRVALSAPVLVGPGKPGRPVFNFPKIAGLR